MKDRTAFRIYASETVVEEGDFEATAAQYSGTCTPCPTTPTT